MPKSRNLEILKRFMISKQMNAEVLKQIDAGYFGSESEFFRQATLNMLRKVDPIHGRPSLKEQEKIDTMKVEEEQAKMSDEEYVKRYLIDVYILTDDDGKKFLIHRMQGRNFGAIPLEQVKEWVKARDWNFEYSQRALKEDPSLEAWEELLKFAGPRSMLAQYYGVNINPENQK